MTDRLDRLLRPRSIAVIGGGAWCRNVIEQCHRIGFQGDLWPVHPTHRMVDGVRALASVDDLPHPPDASFVGVNRATTITVIKALSDRGSGGAVCFASGFREAEAETGDGAALQTQLLTAAGDMPILGPNCYGLINYLDGAALWPDQHGGVPVDSGIALVTQSSNIAINLTMQTRGLPLAYVVTAGNQAQMGLADIGAAMLADPRVTALGLHIEGIDDLRALESLAATARDLGKPIVALKIGASDHAQAATLSHTASLAGSDAGARALLARLGIAQVHSLSSLIETLKLLHVAGPLSSPNIASMSCSGGEASLMADTAHDTALSFPPLNATQSNALRTALGPKVALANPLDYHTYIWGDQAAMTATFTAMMQAPLAMGVVVLDFPRADRCDAADWQLVINAARATQNATGIPMALLGSLSENMPEDVAVDLVTSGITPLCGLAEAIDAMTTAAWLGQNRPAPPPLLLPHLPATSRALTEAEAKHALATHGLGVPRSARVTSPHAAAEASDTIGYPVVLKGEGVAHKTEAGAVALGLTSRDAVEQAAHAMPCDSYLVEEMITGTVAELLIGVVPDPAHGYVLTLAAGGVLTEVLQDSVSLLLPVTTTDIIDALGTLKLAPLLAGYRGAPAASTDAILTAIQAVQSFVIANSGRIAELEINPLMCGPADAIAADALILIGDSDD